MLLSQLITFLIPLIIDSDNRGASDSSHSRSDYNDNRDSRDSRDSRDNRGSYPRGGGYRDNYRSGISQSNFSIN